MIVPNYDGSQIADEDGYPTPNFTNILQTLLKNLTQSIGNEGYLIPSISSAPNSASTPEAPSTLSQIQVLELAFSKSTTPVSSTGQTVTVGTLAGTIVFDPYELNGGDPGPSPPRNPKGQLKVLLNDGTFHAIVNL